LIARGRPTIAGAACLEEVVSRSRNEIGGEAGPNILGNHLSRAGFGVAQSAQAPEPLRLAGNVIGYPGEGLPGDDDLGRRDFGQRIGGVDSVVLDVGREVLTSTMIAARVELIRHLQTVRRRGGRAAAAELEQKPLRISRRASSLPFGASICRTTALSRWGKYGASWPVTVEDQRSPEKGASKSGERPEWFKPNALMIE
jgi:hypothetical protein